MALQCRDCLAVALLGMLLFAAPLHAASTEEADGTVLPSDSLQPKQRNLTAICPPSSRFLNADLTKCEAKDRASPSTPVVYDFELNGTRDFDMLITLRMSSGSAKLQFISIQPATANQPDPVYTLLYHASVSGTKDLGMLSIGRDSLGAGLYEIRVQTVSPSSSFVLKVFTPSKQVRLVDKEVAVLGKLYSSCCPQGPDTDACSTLHDAIAADHTLDVDICNVPPNMCDKSGSLYRLVLRGQAFGSAVVSGLQCTDGVLPTSLVAGLPSLSFLDLSLNLLGGTPQQLAKDLRTNVKLESLRLTANSVSGSLSCDLLKLPALQTLVLSYNNITGSIPPCFLASPTLTALLLSYNSLEGTLPPFAKGIPLTEFWAQADSAQGGALSGSLPHSIANATALRVFAVSNQNFSGGLPDFPESIEELAIDSNSLEGPFPASFSSLSNLTIILASFNNFSGPFPADIFTFDFMETIDLSNNKLTGALSDVSWGDISETLDWIDLGTNSLTGPLPAFPVDSANFAVGSLLLAGNSLNGTLDAFAAALLPSDVDTSTGAATYYNPFVRLGLGGNGFSGTVPAEFLNLKLFNVTDVRGQEDGILNLLDLSVNQLGGEFPVWLVEALVASPVDTYFGINGNAFTCPAMRAAAASVDLASALSVAECTDATSGAKSNVAQALLGYTTGTGTPTPSKGLTVIGASGNSTATASGSSSSSGGKKPLSAAALAGIGVGAVALGAVLLAAVAFVVVTHRKRRRYSDFEAGPKIAMQPLPQQSSLAAENTV